MVTMVPIGLQNRITWPIWWKDLDHGVGKQHGSWCACRGATERVGACWWRISNVISITVHSQRCWDCGRRRTLRWWMSQMLFHEANWVWLISETWSIHASSIYPHWVVIANLSHYWKCGSHMIGIQMRTPSAFTINYAIAYKENTDEKDDYRGGDI